MPVQLPDIAAVGYVAPQPDDQMPSYPGSAPVAAGEEALGQGLERAGRTAETVAAYSDMARTKMDRAMADATFGTTKATIDAALAAETDPAKITALGQQYQGALNDATSAFSNPSAATLWAQEHQPVVAVAEKGAQLRNLAIYHQNYAVGIHQQADAQARSADSDPAAYALAIGGPDDRGSLAALYSAAVQSGSMSPQEAYAGQKATQAQLVDGRTRYLAIHQPADAAPFLAQNRAYLPPETAEILDAKIQTQGTGLRVGAAADRALGLAPNPMLSGGAIPSAIAAEATRQNVSPQTALATAQIESGLGRNLGSRGNIFQLGQPEWASVGGGDMTDAGTQIRNGVAFLGRTQQQLGAALGRVPTQAEIYLAHQQGVGGAVALLSHPDTPAGQLVPAENIRDNGGDPNAPASAFIGKWQGAYNHAAAQFAPVAGALAAAKPGIDVAIGDSIAVQQVRHGVGGQEAPVGQDLAGATARVGDSPQQVLARINAIDPASVAGKTVFLSSGASNDPTQIGAVGDQVLALKRAGAVAVVIPGVGPGVTNADQVNAALAATAKAQGAVFFQPNVTWQPDGVHPAQVDAVRQQAADALAQAGSNAPSNRTGLPSLSQVWQTLQADPTLQTDQERLAAFNKAKTFYDAQEADAARTARLAAAQQKQVLLGAITDAYHSAYSPNPTITPTQIANDPRYESEPDWRRRMIDLVNNPPGSGIPAPQSQAAALDAIDRIRLPDGDPNAITDRGQIYDQYLHKLNRPDWNFVNEQFNQLRATPGGEVFAKRKADFLKAVEPQIDKSAFAGVPDLNGKERFYQFQWGLDQQIDAYRKQGKDPSLLLDPSKSDYVGSPASLMPYTRTLPELLNDLPGRPASGTAPGADPTLAAVTAAKGAEDGLPALRAAVAAGKMSPDAAVALAGSKGWLAAPPAPPTPLVPMAH